MTTIQNNLHLAKIHLKELTHQLNRVNEAELFDIIPRIYDMKKGTYMVRGRKLTYLSKQEKEVILNKIDRSLEYKDLLAKKKELEAWIKKVENEVARLSSLNFPRVAL